MNTTIPAPIAGINLEECDSEVYERGTSVGLFDIPKHDANALCAGISAATGARVDWHYVGGRVHIKALPPVAPVADGSRHARRYQAWRDAALTSDQVFLKAMLAALPEECSDADPRGSAATEWDKAVDAGIAAQQREGGAE